MVDGYPEGMGCRGLGGRIDRRLGLAEGKSLVKGAAGLGVVEGQVVGKAEFQQGFGGLLGLVDFFLEIGRFFIMAGRFLMGIKGVGLVAGQEQVWDGLVGQVGLPCCGRSSRPHHIRL